MKKVGVGIIGTGLHGSRYAAHILNDVAGLELAAISRRSERGREQAAHWGATYYPDWRDLVAADTVEAVIAVTFPTLNLEIARHCAAAGKPLLVEKPLAADSAAAAHIVELFAQRNLKLTVGQTLRYNNIIVALRANLAAVGSLFAFSANQRLEPSSLQWHTQPEHAGAGVTFHTAVHVFDALRFITGREIQRVMAVCRSRVNTALEDMVAVLVELEGEVIGTLDCSKISRARSGRFEFIGSQGQLHGDQIHNHLEYIENATLHPLAHGEPGGTIAPLLRDWQRYLCDEGVNPIPGEAGHKAVQACEACLRSAASGSWVEPRQVG